ncbi:MAG: hypothetical protein JXR97_16360 [Planctomycetes bacterium]|nr:hypothetical protein [Planctomycetota bacterium]
MSTYPQFTQRQSLILDGLWDFAWNTESDLNELDLSTLHFDEIAAVPGVFDTGVNHHGKRGIGIYRLRVRLPRNSQPLQRLEIGALGLRGRIWWDNRELGTADLPYSRIAFDIPDVTAGDHEIIIAVDNRFTKDSTPLFPAYSDFYAYGGIYRSVSLTPLPALRIKQVEVRTLDLAKGVVRLSIHMDGDVPASLPMEIAFDGEPSEQIEAHVKDNTIVLEHTMLDSRPWTPEAPHLHTVRISMNGDEIIQRFGLRTIEARDGSILLNGKPLRLRGVNKHESHPQLGPVQPAHILLDDLMQIKDMGCNFIRAVHYPHAPEFYDLCDQLGLLVWTESLAWGLEEEQLLLESTRAHVLEQTVQMVQEGINHPSIILYGFLNECASDKESSVKLYTDLVNSIRAVDDTRLISYASNRPDNDHCFTLVDVVSVNLYPGWIYPMSEEGTSSVEMIEPCLNRIAALGERPDLAGKPLLITEIGACGLYGCHDRANAQWSEEYQAAFMEEACRVALADRRWSGVTLWQFYDTRSYVDYGNVRCKPRGFNCAGLVDEYRRPKLAYDVIAEIFKMKLHDHGSGRMFYGR